MNRLIKRALAIVIVALCGVVNLSAADLSDLDSLLFRVQSIDPEERLYEEATKYYRAPVSQRRYGIEWRVEQALNAAFSGRSSFAEYREVAGDLNSVRAYGSTGNYRVGGTMKLSTTTSNGWAFALDVDFRTGRNLYVDGCFTTQLNGDLSLSRKFSDNHHLVVNLNIPYTQKGLQSGASQEAITLTGNNLYNSAWGFYEGEVRNARIYRSAVPTLDIDYQRHLYGSTILAVDLMAELGRRSTSQLGWYDSYNPLPDYYRKLPSYISQADSKATIEQLWRDRDSEYTQIAWDKLAQINLLSPDGEAYYVVEDQVEALSQVEGAAMLQSTPSSDIRVIYGVKYSLSTSHRYKQMRDLLGGDYLLDIDQYIGDNEHTSNDMQNNLRDPNRHIGVGDIFGYNYNLRSESIKAVAQLRYITPKVNISIGGEFGDRSTQRVGEYEMERFLGDLSYGESDRVTLPESLISLDMSYNIAGRHTISLALSSLSLSPDSRDLFIAEEGANRLIDNPTSQSTRSAELTYRYSSPSFMLNISGYYLISRDGIDSRSSYDDLTYTYADAVISGIGTRSFGLDIVSRCDLTDRLKLTLALAIGDYTYDVAPEVSLYDDVDLTLFASSTATAIEGCKVGNAPQYLLTTDFTMFMGDGYILSLDGSYAGGRYIAPSFIRRTDRVIRGAASPELESEIVEQQRLDDIVDFALSVTKVIWLKRGGEQISITARINNLMGDNDRVDYARESHRLLSNSASSGATRYLQPSVYYYALPRTFYISCNYKF